jgi:UrcA family protein
MTMIQHYRMIAARAALSGLVTIAAALGTSAAVAGPAYETRSRPVSLRGLDMSTEEGAGIAYQRIRNVARSLCQGSDTSPWAKKEEHRCTDEAVEKTVEKAHSPTLSRLHYKSKVTRLARK